MDDHEVKAESYIAQADAMVQTHQVTEITRLNVKL